MFIELHLIQNFAPSNLNRDDNNMPKDAVFGGVRRARVSSQSWKYAIRKSEVFKETVSGKMGIRTSTLVTLIKERIKNRPDHGILDKVVTDFVTTYAGDFKKKQTDEDGESSDKRTAVLLYLNEEKIIRMAELLNESQTWDVLVGTDKKAAEKSLKKLINNLRDEDTGKNGNLVTANPDIALFGMMLAAKGNNQQIEAACQVAHAISTHRVDMEMDFFTAMDDNLPSGAQGAGMLGQTDFNSSCYYRYARLDWGLLVENLNSNTELARRAVKGFLLAFAQVTPSGKQKPFAALNQPDLALAVVRNGGMGWSLANAFEKPIRPDDEDGGYTERSKAALDGYYGWLKTAYDHPEKSTVDSIWVLTDKQDSLHHLKTPKEKQITNIYAWAESATEALTKMPKEA